MTGQERDDHAAAMRKRNSATFHRQAGAKQGWKLRGKHARAVDIGQELLRAWKARRIA